MEAVTSTALETFLRRLGERSSCAGTLHLLGGSALCLLGNPGTTADADYTFEAEAGSLEQFPATSPMLSAVSRRSLGRVAVPTVDPVVRRGISAQVQQAQKAHRESEALPHQAKRAVEEMIEEEVRR